MKKSVMIGSALAAVLIAGTAAIPALAASDPADDSSSYGYNIGRQAYEARMAEEHAWYDNTDDSAAAGYSFHTGSQAALSRSSAFAEMPAGDDVTKESIEAWFESRGIGEGSAWSDGQYDESAAAGYPYAEGQAAAQQRQAFFNGGD